MSSKGSGGRVLRFAVTGVLLGGPLACDSGKPADASKADEGKPADASKDESARPKAVIDVRPVELDGGATPQPKPEDPPIAINPGPNDDGAAPELEPDSEEHVNEGPVAEPEPEPEPKPNAKEPPKRVNPGPVEAPPTIKTNVGREPDPLAK